MDLPDLPDLGNVSASDKQRLIELLEAKALSSGFLEFAQRVEPAFIVYPHVEFLFKQLERVESGEVRNLAISMPPRHSKSYSASYLFPLWFLWKNPAKTIMLCSYSSSPAERFSRIIRDKIASSKELSKMELSKGIVSKDIWELKTGGGVIAAGVQGALTSMGCDLLIIDDPVKDAAEALSETYRRKAYEWYTSTASTRVEPGGGKILIQTRWHDADLMGMILDAQPEEWEIISLPALAGEDDPMGRDLGEALCPERFDRRELLRKKAEVGEYVFSALYQQDPTPEGGSMFKRAEARTFSWVDADTLRLGERLFRVDELTLFAVADLAGSVAANADYSVIGVLGFTEFGDVVLLDMRRGKWKPSRVSEEIKRAYREWGCRWVTVEKGPVSLSVLEALNDEFVVKAVAPVSNKIARALPAQLVMEQGKLFFPGREDAVWMRAFEDELYRFPTGKHDDQVDVLAWGVDTVKSVGWGVGELVTSHLEFEDGVGREVRFGLEGFEDDEIGAMFF